MSKTLSATVAVASQWYRGPSSRGRSEITSNERRSGAIAKPLRGPSIDDASLTVGFHSLRRSIGDHGTSWKSNGEPRSAPSTPMAPSTSVAPSAP
eukprot:9499261-Pyramimonas_sp.AAC.2